MAQSASAAKSEHATIVSLLGGARTLGAGAARRPDYVALVRQGLPFGSLRAVTEAFTLSTAALAGSLRISLRTLNRRRRARLSPVESERVMRLVRVTARAEHVLGDRAAALDWLQLPNRALDDALPIDQLDTDVGAEEVLEVLGRLEHGLYS